MKKILVKYGEIILKGLNRPVFENYLMNNIRRIIDGADVRCAQATIYITPYEGQDCEVLVERLCRIFGIVYVCVAEVAKKSLRDISDKAVGLMSDKSGTFKVEARRSDKRFTHDSPEICREVGAQILKYNPSVRVDLYNPDNQVDIEVRETEAYVYVGRRKGPGGLPSGTSGKATLMLSGGIDSPVAGYMIAKRGVSIDCMHFFTPPYTSQRVKDKINKLAQVIGVYTGDKITVRIVPFTAILMAIREKCPKEQAVIIMRRFMMEIAERIARENGSSALITGDSLGQVASQTMQALAVTEEMVNIPIFRPLIGMDKEEITQISRMINAFETSVLPYEDCCSLLTPRHPVTKPKFERIRQSEENLDRVSLIGEAVKGIEEYEV